MKRFQQISLSIIVCLLLLSSVPAQAEDEVSITFTVPVQLTSLHQSVQLIRVIVDVRDSGGTKVGTGNTVMDAPSSGNLQQEFTVRITPLSGHNLTEARTYEAILNVHNGEMWAEINDPGVGYIWAQAKENTTLVSEVRGSIEW